MFSEIFFILDMECVCLHTGRLTCFCQQSRWWSPTNHAFVWDEQQSDWSPTSLLQMGWEPPGHSPKVFTDSAHLCSSQKQQSWINIGYWACGRLYPSFLRFTCQGQSHGVHTAPVAWSRYIEMLWYRNKGWQFFCHSELSCVYRRESLPVPLLLSQRYPTWVGQKLRYVPSFPLPEVCCLQSHLLRSDLQLEQRAVRRTVTVPEDC